jgi:hypothetical protein
MGRSKQKVQSGFVLFDVCYEDGTRTSNRKVPASELGGLDGDAPRALLSEPRLSHALRPYTIHPSLRALWFATFQARAANSACVIGAPSSSRPE